MLRYRTKLPARTVVNHTPSGFFTWAFHTLQVGYVSIYSLPLLKFKHSCEAIYEYVESLFKS